VTGFGESRYITGTAGVGTTSMAGEGEQRLGMEGGRAAPLATAISGRKPNEKNRGRAEGQRSYQNEVGGLRGLCRSRWSEVQRGPDSSVGKE
jgi:hypothetical protein